MDKESSTYESCKMQLNVLLCFVEECTPCACVQAVTNSQCAEGTFVRKFDEPTLPLMHNTKVLSVGS